MSADASFPFPPREAPPSRSYSFWMKKKTQFWFINNTTQKIKNSVNVKSVKLWNIDLNELNNFQYYVGLKW
jgi:hypothetical protein